MTARVAYTSQRITVVGKRWKGHSREWSGVVRGWRGHEGTGDSARPTGYWVQCDVVGHPVHRVSVLGVVSIVGEA